MILVGDFIPQGKKVILPKGFAGKLILANLEGPICDAGLPVSDKVGICLRTTLSDGLLDTIRTFAFSLANNHLMDFREEGLCQTKRTLSQYGIPFAGAGMCMEEARKPMILVEEGKRIAVFSCCERQFGMATGNSSGCAELGVWLYSAIKNIKETGGADFVIVSCHSASEYSPWVSPDLRYFYHSLIDAGADCIHGHHAHVPQGYEEYKGRPIFYGLGNFVVNPVMWENNENQLWSVAAEVKFGLKIKWDIKTYNVLNQENSVHVVNDKDDKENRHSLYLMTANRQFESQEMLLGCWQEACVRMYRRLYEQQLRAPSVICHRLSIKDTLRKIRFIFSDLLRIMTRCEFPSGRSVRNGKVLYNYFNCQSHSGAIATALGVLTGVERDFRSSVITDMAERLFGDGTI